MCWVSRFRVFVFLVGLVCVCRRGALLYESPGGNQVDGLPPAFNTGTMVASWHPRRRATIGTFDRKNKVFDGTCPAMLLLISIFGLVGYVLTNFMYISTSKRKTTKEIHLRGNFKK